MQKKKKKEEKKKTKINERRMTQIETSLAACKFPNLHHIKGEKNEQVIISHEMPIKTKGKISQSKTKGTDKKLKKMRKECD